jgi:probable HAF family extracellular repeat protein
MTARFLALVLTLATAAVGRGQVLYNLYDLGAVNMNVVAGNSVNLSGQVAGVGMTTDATAFAFRTGPAGMWQPNDSNLGPWTEAHGINNRGQVTGTYQVIPLTANDPGYWPAFRTLSNTVPGDPGTDLGTLGGYYARGWAINSSGQVAGVSRTSASVDHAFRTTAMGLVSDPGTDIGQGWAFGINDSGQVTGEQPSYGPNGRAFRTTATGRIPDPGTDLGTLGGAWSVGYGINASGQVTGASTNAAGQGHAFRTTATGLVSDPGADLGVLPGGTSSVGQGINALGAVVGSSVVNGKDRAFIYDTQMLDLNNLIPPGTGWVLDQANAINDLGWITGESAAQRGFLLIPINQDPGLRQPIVPEPSSLALAAAAAVTGWAVRGRRSGHRQPPVTAA